MTTFKMEVLCLVVFSVLVLAGAIQQPCVQRRFGHSSVVCVCNATYCDTVEPETKLPIGKYAVYSSTQTGTRFQKTTGHFQHISVNPSVSIRLEKSITKQTILGFGGTFTDAAGMNIANLPEGAQKNLIQTYFGPDGIEYTIGRIPIASNDMSTDVYSYDFTNGDTGLSKFTIAGYDHLYKLPFIDKAVLASRGKNISLIGSPWSSPGWMKTNGDMVGYGTIAPSMSKPYADYLARFLREYDSFMFHGRMWGLTTQSGPVRSCDNASVPEYQSICWTANQTRDWVVEKLKPSLVDAGYGHISLIVMEDNRDCLKEWGQAFNEQSARTVIDGFAVQGYHDGNTSVSVMTAHYKIFPDKFILGSEFAIRQNPTVALGSWERAELMARSIFQDLQNFATGFIDYNLAVNMTGGPSWVNNNADSAIVVDSAAGVFYKQPMFYIMGHFSKFVTPKSKAIQLLSTGMVQELVPAVAFVRPDNSVVVVMANMQAVDIDVEILDGKNVLRHRLEKHSICTFIWWKE